MTGKGSLSSAAVAATMQILHRQSAVVALLPEPRNWPAGIKSFCFCSVAVRSICAVLAAFVLLPGAAGASKAVCGVNRWCLNGKRMRAAYMLRFEHVLPGTTMESADDFVCG